MGEGLPGTGLASRARRPRTFSECHLGARDGPPGLPAALCLHHQPEWSVLKKKRKHESFIEI